jgi:hypothetical protein
MSDKTYTSFLEPAVQQFEIPKCNPSARVPGAPKPGNLCPLPPPRTPNGITFRYCLRFSSQFCVAFCKELRRKGSNSIPFLTHSSPLI